MQAILAVTVPFFALVLLGYLAVQRNYLPESAIPGLNGFVLFFALPFLIVLIPFLLKQINGSGNKTIKNQAMAKLDAQTQPVPEEPQQPWMMRWMPAFAVGLGVLEPLLADERVRDTGRFDVIADYAEPLPVLVIADLRPGLADEAGRGEAPGTTLRARTAADAPRPQPWVTRMQGGGVARNHSSARQLPGTMCRAHFSLHQRGLAPPPRCR